MATQHSRAMKASARPTNRSKNEFWTPKGFSEWVLSTVEQVIFILFILGFLLVIAWSLFTTGVSTIGLIRAMTADGAISEVRLAALWLFLGTFAISIGMIIGYLVSFIVSVAPILALLRIADNTRLTSEILRRKLENRGA